MPAEYFVLGKYYLNKKDRFILKMIGLDIKALVLSSNCWKAPNMEFFDKTFMVFKQPNIRGFIYKAFTFNGSMYYFVHDPSKFSI